MLTIQQQRAEIERLNFLYREYCQAVYAAPLPDETDAIKRLNQCQKRAEIYGPQRRAFNQQLQYVYEVGIPVIDSGDVYLLRQW